MDPILRLTSATGAVEAPFNRPINPKMRKRTKTGCLTCRKRRIKCGEEHPRCQNCADAKRMCEGYSQRAIFKPPIEDWPNHPGVVSTIKYHTSMLPGTRNNPFWPNGHRYQQWTSISTRDSHASQDIAPDTRSFRASSELLDIEFLDQLSSDPMLNHGDSPTSTVILNPIHPLQLSTYDFSPCHPTSEIGHRDIDQLEVVDYLDDDYYDLDSDDDSAIFMRYDSPSESALGTGFRLPHTSTQGFEYKSALDVYRPQHTATPLRDPCTARFFATFIHTVGPSLGFIELYRNDSLFTYQIPSLALKDLALLHAILALTTSHVASLQCASRTPALKHYAYSMKRLSRAIATQRTRLRPSTLTTVLLLAVYEFLCGEHKKWTSHLIGLIHIVFELDLKSTLATGSSELDHGWTWNLTQGDEEEEHQRQRPIKPQHSYRDLIWCIAKQDIYHAILCGQLVTPPGEWRRLLAIASQGPRQGPNWGGIFRILMEIADFKAKEHERRLAAYSLPHNAPETTKNCVDSDESIIAIKRWSQIDETMKRFRVSALKALHGGTDVHTGKPVLHTVWKAPELASFWAVLYMGELLLARCHPKVPCGLVLSLLSTRLKTSSDAVGIRHTISSILPETEGEPATPEVQGALTDCVLPLFFAAAQYNNAGWRTWAVETFKTIAKLTGWQLASTASVAVQHVWVGLYHLGEGPSWMRMTEPTFEAETRIMCGSSWGLFDEHSWHSGVQPEVNGEPTADLNRTPVNSPSPPSVTRQEYSVAESTPEAYCDTLLERPNLRHVDGKEGNRLMVQEIPKESLLKHRTSIDSSCRYFDSVSSTDAHSDSSLTDQSNFSNEASRFSEEEFETSFLDIRKQEIVNRVMDYFHTMIRAKPSSSVTSGQGVLTPPHKTTQKAGLIEITHDNLGSLSILRAPDADGVFTTLAASGQDGSSTVLQNTDNNMGCANDTMEPRFSKSVGKRPRTDDDDDQFGSDDEGAPSKRPRVVGPSYSPCEKKRKFACPYFKRNPERYLARRSCVGPGWDEVRRVKEHLYRNHAIPIFCSRCYETFKSGILLQNHQRAEEPCKTQPIEIMEGLDKEQEKKLRSRKKTCPDLTEEQKWKEMYRLLFPSDDEMTMPSAYLDEDWERIYQNRSKCPSNELARYEEFLRRELPPAVRQELEIAVEREFHPMEERLKSQLIDIVRNLQLRLFQSYTQAAKPKVTNGSGVDASTPTDSVEQASRELRASDNRLETAALPISDIANEAPVATLEQQLASYEPPPPLEEPVDYDFDAVRFQLEEWSKNDFFPDSTYGSDEFNFWPDWPPMDGDYEQYQHGRDPDNGEGSSGTR